MIEPVQNIMFTGRVTNVSEADAFTRSPANLVDRSITVDLGEAGSVSFSYTSSENGGLAFVKRGDLVQVTLSKLGASPTDAGA